MNFTTYTYLVIIQYCFGLIILPVLLIYSAPYGRHFREGWGPVMQSRMAWLLMEFPAVLIIALVYIGNAEQQKSSLSWIFLAMWQTHYIYRTFIYPWLLRGSRRTFPWLLAIFALLFNVTNGLINGYALFVLQPKVTVDYFTSCPAVTGMLCFAAGLAINIQSDATIRGLRRHLEFNGKGQYGIPTGGLFRYVSNPHYLGEIIEWAGWALLTRNAAGWAFAWFTFANLMPRAILNHRWYLKTFPKYPKQRKALIPYIL
jgi:3-oxo-5-alpha-steroid 4-dehydrogenase 1